MQSKRHFLIAVTLLLATFGGYNLAQAASWSVPQPTVSSPKNNAQVKSPLTIKGTTSKYGQIEVNVAATYTGGTQDLGTFKARANSHGNWQTTPINLWAPQNVKNVKFHIAVIRTLNKKESFPKIVTVLPPRKVKLIPRAKINRTLIKQLNPRAIAKIARPKFAKQPTLSANVISGMLAPKFSSPRNNARVNSPLTIKGTAVKNQKVKVNVKAIFTGGSQDLGTLMAPVNSKGNWNTLVNLWAPEGARNVKFQIVATRIVGKKEANSSKITVLPLRKLKTIPRAKINQNLIKQLNPKIEATKAKPRIIGKMPTPRIGTAVQKTKSKKTVKLKVTLLQLQCALSDDSDKIDDYGITQHVWYKANGRIKKPITTDIKKFPNHTSCPPGGEKKLWKGSTALVCGNKDRQIQVPESTVTAKRTANIDSSLVFEITPQEANDKNAKFVIDTWVKEYTDSPWFVRDNWTNVLNRDPRKMKVAIHDVLAILKGTKKLRATNKYFDHDVSQKLKFDNFDGVSLPLRKVNYSGRTILEGPIRARNKQDNVFRKAFVWMRFELID